MLSILPPLSRDLFPLAPAQDDNNTNLSVTPAQEEEEQEEDIDSSDSHANEPSAVADLLNPIADLITTLQHRAAQDRATIAALQTENTALRTNLGNSQDQLRDSESSNLRLQSQLRDADIARAGLERALNETTDLLAIWIAEKRQEGLNRRGVVLNGVRHQTCKDGSLDMRCKENRGWQKTMLLPVLTN